MNKTITNTAEIITNNIINRIKGTNFKDITLKTLNKPIF